MSHALDPNQSSSSNSNFDKRSMENKENEDENISGRNLSVSDFTSFSEHTKRK